MKDFKSAKLFAEVFWKMDEENWSGMKSAVMFTLLSFLLARGIDAGFIEFDDFYKYNDKEIIKTLENHKNEDEELKKYFEYLNLPVEYYKNDKNNYLKKIFCKNRKINPYFLNNGNLVRVSEFDENFKEKIGNISKSKEYYISIK